MRPAIKIICVVVMLAALGACQHKGDQAAQLLWPDQQDSYVQATKEWTRSGTVYDGINLAFSAAGTLKSSAWREAYAAKNGQVFAMTPDETAKVLADQRRAHQAGTEVVLSLVSSHYGGDKLSLYSPRWSLFALQGENKLYPVEIRAMKRDVWPASRIGAFFPYATRWRKFYAVRFDPVLPGPLTVVLSGPEGHVELNWEHFE